jgi:hypothetical protein
MVANQILLSLTLGGDVPPAAADLAAWQRVYAGLSDEDIAEVEKIALDRSRFLRRQPE